MKPPDLSCDTAAKERPFASCGPLGRGIALVECDHLTLSVRQGPFFILTIFWVLMTLLIATLPLLSMMLFVDALIRNRMLLAIAVVMLLLTGLVTFLAALSIVRAALPRRIVVDRRLGLITYQSFPWSHYALPIKTVEHIALAHSNDRKLVYLNLVGSDSCISTFRFKEADVSFSPSASFAAFGRTAQLLADYIERPYKLVEVQPGYIWSARPWL